MGTHLAYTPFISYKKIDMSTIKLYMGQWRLDELLQIVYI